MPATEPGETVRTVIADLIMASFPGLVAFFLLPLTVYTSNQIDFDHRLGVLWPILAMAAACCLASCMLLVLPAAMRTRVCRWLFLGGSFFLLCDLVTPVRWGLLDGTGRVVESWRSTAIQIVLLTSLAWVGRRIPVHGLRKLAASIVPLLCLIQLITAAVALDARTTWWGENSASGAVPPTRTAGETAKQHNVYHFVFDGYSSLLFENAVRTLALENSFRGFSFFSRNMANYTFTDESVPSFLTGTFYGGGSFRDWQLAAKESGLAENLHTSGFRIWNYTPDRTRFWAHQRAALGTTGADLMSKDLRGIKTASIVQISIVRISPDFLRREVSRRVDRLLGRVLGVVNRTQEEGRLSNFMQNGFYKRLAVPLLRQFIEDEHRRGPSGEYVYLHVIIPHSPMRWAADCTPSESANFESQSLCVTRLMGEIIAELKRLGHFEQSLVIFQSDHGYHAVPEERVDLPMDPIVTRKLREVGSYFTATEFLARTRALLLARRPFAPDAPMEVSKVDSQLVDIPATVYDALGLKFPPGEGHSLFRLDPHEQREIHVFSGARIRDEDDRIRRLGSDVTSMSFGHLSYTRGQGWKSHADIIATFQ